MIQLVFLLIGLFTGLATYGNTLNDWLNHELDSDAVPNFCYAVVSAESELSSNCFGTLRTGSPVDRNSIFRIGSTSKAFTTLALNRILRDKNLSWDAKVFDLFSDYPLYKNDPHRVSLTLNHLTTHRSGVSLHAALPTWTNWHMYRYNMYPRMTEMIERSVNLNLLFDPGIIWSYSNFAFDQLAYIGGRLVSPRPLSNADKYVYQFNKAVREHFFSGLGLQDSFFDVGDEEDRRRMVSGFGFRDDSGQRPSSPDFYTVRGGTGSIGAAMSLTASIKWLQSQLQILKGDLHREVITRQEFIEILAPQLALSKSMVQSRGYFWQKAPTGDLSIMIRGTTSGTRSRFDIYPERNLGIVVLANVADLNREKYANKIFEYFRPNETVSIPELSDLLQSIRRSMNSFEMPTTPTFERSDENVRPELRFLLGKYRSPFYGDFHLVGVPDGRLAILRRSQISPINLESRSERKWIFRMGPTGYMARETLEVGLINQFVVRLLAGRNHPFYPVD